MSTAAGPASEARPAPGTDPPDHAAEPANSPGPSQASTPEAGPDPEPKPVPPQSAEPDGGTPIDQAAPPPAAPTEPPPALPTEPQPPTEPPSTGPPAPTEPPPAPTAPPPAVQALMLAHAEGRRQAEGGDLTGARTTFEQALITAELQLGREHPNLAPVMVDLATLARKLGNLTEAQTQLRRAYGIIIASSGPEHPVALSVEGRLAAVTFRLGEPTEAYDWHIADVGTRVLGPDHPAVRGAQLRLAEHPPALPEDDPTPGQRIIGRIVDRDEPNENEYSTYIAQPYTVAGMPGVTTGYHAHPSAEGVYLRVPDSDDQDRSAAQSATYLTTDDADLLADGESMDGHGIYQAGANDSSAFATVGGPHGLYEPAPREWPSAADLTAPPGSRDLVHRDARPLAPAEPILHMPRNRRAHAGGITLVVSLGAVVLVAAAIVATQFVGFLRDRTPSSGDAPGATAPGPARPSPGGSAAAGSSLAPINVRLKDSGGSVTLTWSDPSDGQVPFIVGGGRTGEAPRPYETVPAGRTTSTIYGLNDRYDYCFMVSAVWSSDQVAPSAQVCTNRSSLNKPPT